MSYPSDALSDDITALISTAPTLAAAADSIATIQNGTDVVVSNFAGVEAVFDKLQAFLSELQSGHFYTPVGALMPFAGLSAYVPSGWLVCDGSSYAASGASADLQTILNAAGFSALPNLKGRTIIGVGAGAEITATLGAVQGGASSILDNTHIPQHSHTINHDHAAFTIDGGGHEHTIGLTQDSVVPRGTGVVFDRVRFAGSVSTGGGGGHTHSVDVPNFEGNSGNYGTASPTGVPIVQPSLPLNYIIKN